MTAASKLSPLLAAEDDADRLAAALVELVLRVASGGPLALERAALRNARLALEAHLACREGRP